MVPRTYEGARLHASWRDARPDRNYPVIGLTQGRGRIATALSRATWRDVAAVVMLAVVFAWLVLL